MLSKINRFHGHNTVRRTYKTGKVTRGGLMSMHVSTDKRIKRTKAAVVVSKKIHKSAVKRNRIRRRIYEIIRLQLPNIKSPAEIVVTIYKPEVYDLPSKELKRIVEKLLKNSKLI